jgi:hypothetical protein
MDKLQPVLIELTIHKGLNIKFETEYLKLAESVLNKSTKDMERSCIIKPFLFALINRAMVTSNAIETLINSGNYESTLPLLRVLFDCGLQIKAATMADNKEEFYTTYGESKAKRKVGNKLIRIKEGEIAKSLDDDKWTSEGFGLYKFLCGYIHFSSYHYSLLSNNTSSLSIGKLILKDDPDIVVQIKQCYNDVSEAFIEITRYYIDKLWN